MGSGFVCYVFRIVCYCFLSNRLLRGWAGKRSKKISFVKAKTRFRSRSEAQEKLFDQKDTIEILHLSYSFSWCSVPFRSVLFRSSSSVLPHALSSYRQLVPFRQIFLYMMRTSNKMKGWVRLVVLCCP